MWVAQSGLIMKILHRGACFLHLGHWECKCESKSGDHEQLQCPAWPRKAAPAALLSPGRVWPRPLSMVNVRPGSAQPLIGSSRVIPGLSLVAHHLSCCFSRPKQGQFKSHSSVGYRLLDRWHVTVAALKSWRPRSLCRITTSTPDPALWGPT